MGRFDALYARLPVRAQHYAVTAFGAYRHWVGFGPGYVRFVRDFASREWFTPTEWRAWERARLSRVLADAARVPYYRDAWGPAGRAAAERGELAELPLLQKDAVRVDPHAFVRPGPRPWPRLVHHTSGSTGTPVANFYTVAEWRANRAVREARSMVWAGVSYAMPRATFSGRQVEPDPASSGPFHRYNAVDRQVYLSAFHLRPATARQYVDALGRHGVQWLTGYAVSFHLLATLMLEQGLAPPPLRAVITTSEKLTPEMRRTMGAAFGCRVYEEYGTVENTIFASECPEGRLHVSPDVGVVEILRPDGTACEPGEAGEVVTTALSRRYQPLVRYRLGDVASWGGEPCTCGRAMPVLREVQGRLEDVVVGPDGRRMVRFHGVFIGLANVREGQVVQEAVDFIRLRVVPGDHGAPVDGDEMARRVRQRLGTVRVQVELVDAIPRTRSGKFKAVISNLTLEQRRRAALAGPGPDEED